MIGDDVHILFGLHTVHDVDVAHVVAHIACASCAVHSRRLGAKTVPTSATLYTALASPS